MENGRSRVLACKHVQEAVFAGNRMVLLTSLAQHVYRRTFDLLRGDYLRQHQETAPDRHHPVKREILSQTKRRGKAGQKGQEERGVNRKNGKPAWRCDFPGCV